MTRIAVPGKLGGAVARWERQMDFERTRAKQAAAPTSPTPTDTSFKPVTAPAATPPVAPPPAEEEILPWVPLILSLDWAQANPPTDDHFTGPQQIRAMMMALSGKRFNLIAIERFCRLLALIRKCSPWERRAPARHFYWERRAPARHFYSPSQCPEANAGLVPGVPRKLLDRPEPTKAALGCLPALPTLLAVSTIPAGSNVTRETQNHGRSH